MDIAIAGAGMGGLAAAARARELGASTELYEKGERPGGSMLLSSGMVWRYREFEEFRRQCPDGDERLQRLVHDRFDDAVAWLERLGAPVVARETGNELTKGVRFDPRGLTETLAVLCPPRLGEPAPAELRPLVLATGGFHASRELVAEHITPEPLRIRGNKWSDGDGLRLGLAAGGSLSAGMDEFYGRNMPAPPAEIPEGGFVRLAQLYAHHAEVVNESGEPYPGPVSWSEIDVVQWTARQPGARAWYLVDDAKLSTPTRYGTIGELIEAARAAGGRVERRGGRTAVLVGAGITTTIGGLRVDERARAADGVWACGADAGGVATGGYMSGLAAALVLGLTAAEDALS